MTEVVLRLKNEVLPLDFMISLDEGAVLEEEDGSGINGFLVDFGVENNLSVKFGWKPALQHLRVQQKRSGKIPEAKKCQTQRVLPFPLCCSHEKGSAGTENFRGRNKEA